MTFTPEQIAALQAPLDKANVKEAPKGKYGSYIDAHHALSEANRIFGHDGWGYTISSLMQCSRVETESNGNPQIRVGYRCTVRVEAGGVWREGAAVGSGMSKPENEHDAHESAVKEAETDALKRALRSFGNTFGLALYDKGGDAAITTPLVNEGHIKALRETARKAGIAEAKLLTNLEVTEIEAVTVEQYEFAVARMNEAIKKAAKQTENA